MNNHYYPARILTALMLLLTVFLINNAQTPPSSDERDNARIEKVKKHKTLILTFVETVVVMSKHFWHS